MEQGQRIQDLQEGGIAMKEKRDISQEPAYQELANLLAGMSEDRREALAILLEKEMEKDFMTTANAAARLHVKQATVRLWLTQGKLKGRRFGGRWRVNTADVERMLAGESEQV